MLPGVPTRAVRQVTTLLSCLCAIVSIGSCDKVPLLAPTESVITLVSNRAVLPINGTAQIVAIVIEQSGTPAHNGTLVTFTTTLGTLDPREAVTNNGQAVVTLRAGTESGTAEVGAFSGSARTEAPVMIAIGGAVAVNLSVGPSPGTVDQVVTFTATATGTTVPIASYAWNFGDGTTVTTSGNTVNHVYTSADTYTITVTVTTVEGVTGSTQITLIVVPLQVEILLTVSPANPTTGVPVTFTATVTPATVVVTQYDWVFGDGDTLLDGGRVTIHPYAAVGTFTAKVTATLADTSTVDTQAVVTVTN